MAGFIAGILVLIAANRFEFAIEHIHYSCSLGILVRMTLLLGGPQLNKKNKIKEEKKNTRLVEKWTEEEEEGERRRKKERK